MTGHFVLYSKVLELKMYKQSPPVMYVICISEVNFRAL